MIVQRQQWEDLGPALPVSCPMCRERGLFTLHAYQADYRLFGILKLFSGGGRHRLHCPHCDYQIDVDGEDIAVARALVEQAKLCRSGEASREDFLAYVADHTPGCVAALAAVSQDQVCPKCGELVPATFSVCWNCSAELEAVPASAAEGPDAEHAFPDPEDIPSSFGGIQI